MRQAESAAERIQSLLACRVELLPLSTSGDQRLEWSLEKEGGKGLFTKELEQALLDGRADLAVHSAKDLPTDMPDGLEIAAFLPREDPRDVVALRLGVDHPQVLASGSPRRRAQAKRLYPDASWVELRGNVQTRLEKISLAGLADGTFLAQAGLNRLGVRDFPGLVLEAFALERMVPAPGQGAIAIQSRAEEAERFSILEDEESARSVRFEREILSALGGGCQVALGVHHRSVDDCLYFFHEACGIRTLAIGRKKASECMHTIMQWIEAGN